MRPGSESNRRSDQVRNSTPDRSRTREPQFPRVQTSRQPQDSSPILSTTLQLLNWSPTDLQAEQRGGQSLMRGRPPYHIHLTDPEFKQGAILVEFRLASWIAGLHHGYPQHSDTALGLHPGVSSGDLLVSQGQGSIVQSARDLQFPTRSGPCGQRPRWRT